MKRKNPENEHINKNTLKKRRQRENIKKDPIRLEESRRKDRERKKIQRNHMKKHQLEEYRAKKRIENDRYRQKKKEETAKKNPEPKKAEASKKRERRKKRKSLIDLEQNLRESKKKKEVLRVKIWRMRIKLNQNNENENPFKTPGKEKYALKKAKQALPKSPRKREKIIKKLFGERSENSEISTRLLRSFNEHVQDIKPKGGASNARRTAYSILKSVINKTGRYRVTLQKQMKIRTTSGYQKGGLWWKPKSRKPRKDRISDTLKDKIRAFYLDPLVSREIPDRRSAMKLEDGTLLQRHNMTMTMEDAFSLFKKNYPDDKIGFTSFIKLRPIQIKKISETSRKTCLCQKCCNVALKADALKKHLMAKQNVQNIKISKRELVDITLCKYNDRPSAQCIERTCNKCGSHLLSQHFQEIIQECKNDEVSYNNWEYISITREEKEKRVMSCVNKKVKLTEFFSNFEDDVESLASHLFRADWQHSQMKTCINTLSKDEACVCMDYAESYQCRFQGEVQSAFFEQNMVTIHPMMAYYTQGDLNIKHAIIGITNDHHKDSNGVKMFEQKAIAIIQKKKGHNLKTVHEFTDGCASQYKGKDAFYDVSEMKRPKVIRNFFETSHGKSVCDGLGAIVKGSCYQAVVSGQEIIGSAEDLFNFCERRLAVNKPVSDEKGNVVGQSIREFIFIDQKQVSRERPLSKTLVGTRKLHAVRSTGVACQIMIRNLSCYCDMCLKCNYDGCRNNEYCKKWELKQIDILPVKSVSKTKTDTDTSGSSKVDVTGQNMLTDSDSNKDIDVSEGDFVTVQLGTRRVKKIFVAEVINMTADELQLKYMKKTGNLYMWPDADDISWEPRENCLKKLRAPQLVNGREQFKFDDSI